MPAPRRTGAIAAAFLLLAAGCAQAPERMTAERARLMLSDSTTVRYDGRSPSVTYRSATGEAHTWRVDGAFTAPSRWNVSEGPGGEVRLCHTLTTGTGPSRPGCESWERFDGARVDSLAGDPFGLASGLAPERLTNQRHDAASLRALVGASGG